MVEVVRLLADLKRLKKKLEDDLRRHHAASAGRAAVEAEWKKARDSKRTADTFETFLGAAIDQAAVHWVLALVFLRFLEDNRLLDGALVAGPGERLELAQLRQRDWFRTRPQDSDAEYLLAVFGEVARLPGLAGLFDPDHNPLFRLPVSGDGAIALFEFFRARNPATGELLHDFTDADWNTRFLGDLYQDLSEEARKHFALLQTPEFVEQWILSRTLDPAIREFGIEQVRMIDPTCGSGHFLLGGFARLLEEWRRHAPEMPPAAQAQKALDAVAGVDVNPFAVEIARFRLLVAALKAAGVPRLAAAPDFRLSLATGDSLLHGRHFARQELGGTEEGFRRVLRHHYAAEDMGALEAILGRQYQAVVGNPPYITPKDAAMRDAYREIYESCHGKYALGVPFIERFFDLAQQGTPNQGAGFVGLIVSNSFTKREFGKKLIERILARLDLTHVVDCSGAYIPGHGTPTVMLLGRNRAPVASVVRTVRGVRGEPSAPEDPAHGFVWSAIVAQTDEASSESEFISTEDTSRQVLMHHPWNLGGGGAMDVQERIESNDTVLTDLADVGVMAVTGEDDAYSRPSVRHFLRFGVSSDVRSFIEGDQVRDWRVVQPSSVIYPYNESGDAIATAQISLSLWPFRTLISAGVYFGKTKEQRRMIWQEYGILVKSKADRRPAITFAEVATHNHFVLDRGGKVFKQTAPVIKLPAGATEDEHLGLLGVLNSSTACFWLKQVCHNKGDSTDAEGARTTGTDTWINTYQFNGSRVSQFPLVAELPINLAKSIDAAAQHLESKLPGAVCSPAVPNRKSLNEARIDADAIRARMIALQEELDWHCYRLYGLIEDTPGHPTPPPLRLGERAFEIVMARRMNAGEMQTTWFQRHRATPITKLPSSWPADYRAVVERRVALIESDAIIGLIERPEHKRRWSNVPWEEMERAALRSWLLDRLEDPRYWTAADPHILSARSLADATRRDAEFQSVAELYVGRAGFDLEALVVELVAGESVPFLAALRYTESGLRKRADWEATWEKQRAEDAIDVALGGGRDEFRRAAWLRQNPRREAEAPEAYAERMAAGLSAEAVEQAADVAIAAEAKRRKAQEVGDIPVPPKYRTPDFQSAVFWRLRGGLDLPKERFVSFPHCARDADPSLPILWAGHDHLARARALAALYVERRESEGWPPERLVPMLAGLRELVPWLRQWHNDLDAGTGLRMGDFFAGYVQEQARELGLTLSDLGAWTPPVPVKGRRKRKTAA